MQSEFWWCNNRYALHFPLWRNEIRIARSIRRKYEPGFTRSQELNFKGRGFNVRSRHARALLAASHGAQPECESVDFSQGRKTGWSGKPLWHSREPSHNSTHIRPWPGIEPGSPWWGAVYALVNHATLWVSYRQVYPNLIVLKCHVLHISKWLIARRARFLTKFSLFKKRNSNFMKNATFKLS